MSDLDILKRIRSELDDAKAEVDLYKNFMGYCYELWDRNDQLMNHIYDVLGNLGVDTCDTCEGTGGVELGTDEDGVVAWSHPANEYCHDCFGIGRNTMDAVSRHSDMKRKKEKSKVRFKESEMRLVIK